MSGIYLHIPFCAQACHYCNFHFATSLRYKNEMLAALLKELELRRSYMEGDTIATIYFGGGTPSLLETNEIKILLDKIKELFPVIENAEITLETNPDDISEEKLREWKRSGINRLSIGVQSFFDEDLQWMNRAHNASQAVGSLQSAVREFQNISMDLIYGMPGLTNEKLKQNVEKAISFNIPHLSCYALTVEPKTPLDKMIRQKRYADIDPDKQSEQFLLLMKWLGETGYEHYEISNFAKPGWRSRHNSAYWSAGINEPAKKYLGIGPSAHSFDGKSRQWNISNNTVYTQSIEKGEPQFEIEILSPTQQLNEYIMTSLRTMEGIQLEKMGIEKDMILTRSRKFIERGLIKEEKNALVLTSHGKLVADGIAAELFF